jgi:hypothetical protein
VNWGASSAESRSQAPPRAMVISAGVDMAQFYVGLYRVG